MDTFAAIALSTEPPVESILKEPPTTNSQILTPAIFRQIIGVSLWNFLLTLGLFIFGPILLDLESFNYYGAKIHRSSDNDKCDFDTVKQLQKIKKDNKGAQFLKDCDPFWQGQMKLHLFTIVLVTFVMLQVFNYINCRKIGANELNVFSRIFKKFNIWFWFIIAFTCGVQYLMVDWFYFLSRTKAIRKSEWGACIIAGSTVLVIAWIIKFIPDRFIAMIPFTKFIDENEKVSNAAFDKLLEQSQQKVNIPANLPRPKKQRKAKAMGQPMQPQGEEFDENMPDDDFRGMK